MNTTRNIPKALALAMIAITLPALAACSASVGDATAPGARTITFINPAPGQPIWQVAADCFVAAAEDAGVTGQVVGTPGSNAAASDQLRFIEQAVAQGADGIVSTSFTADTAVESAFEMARDAGVLVATMESGDATQARNFDVGIDITQFGRDVAQQIASTPGPHRVAMVLPGLSGTPLQFQQAFEDEIEGLDDIELAQVVSDNGIVTDDAALVSAMLVADPTITEIVAPNPGSTAGIITAIRESGRVGEVTLIANSIGEPAPQGLEDGTISAVYLQNICDVGRLAVTNMVAIWEGEDVPRTIPVETDFATKETIDDFDTDTWF